MYKLSIIIPIYNTYSYLQECINSVLNQPINQNIIEIILVDDGSTDNKSPYLCDELKSKYTNIKVIHKKNGGISSARNIGLSVATGQYTLFIDSDDVLMDNILQTIFLDIKNNLDYDILSYDYVFYDGTKILETNQFSLLPNELSANEFEKFKFILTNQKTNWSVWNKVYKTKLIKKFLFNENLNMAEDLLWSVEVLNKTTKIYASNNPIIKYRINNNSSLTKLISSKKFIDLLEALNQVYKILLNQNLEKKQYKYIISILNKNILSIMSQLEKFKKSEKQLLIKNLKKMIIYLKSSCKTGDKIAYLLSKILGISITGKILSIYKKNKNS